MEFPEFQADRYRAVVEYIKAHPEEYNQKSWHSSCGTTACFAGRAQIMSGKAPDKDTTRRDAKIWLGLTKNEADYLFDGNQLFDVIAGYDSDGYDRAGYDSDGYDRDGYDSDGYDSDGLDFQNKPRGES
jgi:hypothetical protein